MPFLPVLPLFLLIPGPFSSPLFTSPHPVRTKGLQSAHDAVGT